MSEKDNTPSGDIAADAQDGTELPQSVVDQAERLSRLAREAVDDAEAEAYRERRAGLVDEYDYAARVRHDDEATLVCYPQEWLADGVVQMDRIEDTDRAVEVSLSGPGDPDEWRAVDRHNRELVEQVREEHGEVHARNATAFADFAGNHYAKPVESLTETEMAEFLEEYFPRNAWPSEEQRDVVERSLELVYETAGERVPGS
ncbi:DUF7108 family protein [Haloarchaeobius iranensis]|uniref:RnhA operon protein n=1 Tax=Haloarchaeobius iranensis TaxID=996166 RepID=A0A1G9T8R2_9EURY|nr:rnhA operon protein [Haloarchaeobius iranensis]SDM44054.1 hypothetical protein SAMN05192554_102204 [Haloarchaeobius iranensis]